MTELPLFSKSIERTGYSAILPLACPLKPDRFQVSLNGQTDVYSNVFTGNGYGRILQIYALWKPGKLNTTLELSDELYREVKAVAALKRKMIKDSVSAGKNIRKIRGYALTSPASRLPASIASAMVSSISR